MSQKRQLLLVFAAAAVVALVAAGLAGALGRSVPPPPTNPTSADQIQNIDQVKTAIKAYYGDTATDQNDPVPNSVDGGTVKLHQSAPASAYAIEVAGVVSDAERYLRNHAGKKDDKKNKKTDRPGKAIVFDIDDTTLNTFSYEIYSNFVYNPGTNASFVNACLQPQDGGVGQCDFPAVPGMVDLEKEAVSLGYTVFFLTGRPHSATSNQLPGTLANLKAAGYDVDEDNVYLKDASGASEPWLAPCAPTCSTIQYKSLTRQHIESLGYNIEANFGDQFSDLEGGFADKTFKLPNPMYYLP